MSVKYMTAVWEDSSLTNHPDLLIMLALADHASDEGKCWPSFAGIARKSRVSERHVFRRIKVLLASGHIKVLEPGNRVSSNSYRLMYEVKSKRKLDPKNAQEVVTPCQEGGDTVSGGGGDKLCQGGGDKLCHSNHHRTVISTEIDRETAESGKEIDGMILKEVRLHGLPSSVEEVVAAGKLCREPKSEKDCHKFWNHYESHRKTGPNGEIFWVTAGDNPSVITRWKLKLENWEATTTGNSSRPRIAPGRKGQDI